MDPSTTAVAAATMPSTLLTATLACVVWAAGHWYVFAVAVAAVGAAAELCQRRLATVVARERMALDLVPAPYFDPSHEEIFRRGVELARACTAVQWWAPRRSKSVRIRLRADGTRPFAYRVEGPAGAQRLLTTTPFGPHVRVTKAAALEARPREHEVRAEFIMRGNPVQPLRDVPLEPDPLQPLVDAVAEVRAQVGDLAEVCVDLQRAPKWALRARRWDLMSRAHRAEQREAARTWRWMRRDSDRFRDTVFGQMRQLTIGGGRGRDSGPLMVPPTPQRVDRDKALGKLAEDRQLIRVQILVRCASNIEGRAEAQLARIQAGLDVFGGSARLAMRGLRVGPWRLGADRWPHRGHFDRRWRTGQCQPPGPNWVRIEELLGLLKPPTVHCRLPLLPTELPTWVPGDRSLLLQGWYRGPDGTRRPVATRAAETLFEIGVGKAGGGKTERALAQAIAYAHAGGGLLFVDPHHDSWRRGAPYLAHESIMSRIARVDLRGAGPKRAVSSWNPIGMHHGRPRHEVVEDVVDAFASAFGWDDASAPRALAIFTEVLTVLCAVNEAACRAERASDQATLFHVRALLTDQDFRLSVLAAMDDVLDEESHAWWRDVFPTFAPEAFSVLLNPLGRLAANPVTRAFLGQGRGVYDIRTAMDRRMVVWVCTAGNGPTDRLLVTLLFRDLLRAGRSRVDTSSADRVPFRGYLDELITLTGSAPDSIASMFEDFRKFNIQLHGMTQLLGRLPQSVRQSLVQNASTLSTTHGAKAAVTPITEEWGDRPSAAQVAGLDRFEHYATFTVGGRRVGPLLIRGTHLDDDFARWARYDEVNDLEQAADRMAGARPLSVLTQRAAAQLDRVKAFIAPQDAGSITTNPRNYQ
ncbi:ATP/GTP-binding protein [Streptomyces mirabilis]|uniref:ATP/GTP-binding protein n=1 Tax=Streptomyces mirabilis TaxID=68239 RepID=UPI0036977B40